MTEKPASEKPAYIVHEIDEDDVTVDWFFGDASLRTKLVQLVLIVIGWFFAILPLVIEISALTHRHDRGGWWNYHEGFVMFDVTMSILGVLLVLFAVGYLALHILSRSRDRRHRDVVTYDEERLALRVQLALELCASKYGERETRHGLKNVRIEPYNDIETYELRDFYRTYGAD